MGEIGLFDDFWKDVPPPETRHALNLYRAAQVDFKRGAVESAMIKLEEVIKIAPGLVNTHMLLGQCYIKKGRPRSARTAFLRELFLNPDNRRAESALYDLEFIRSQQAIDLHFPETEPPPTWPTVSLCMIVKNEENNLADCLRSAGDFASEIIIVDTGSSDRTVEIAKSFGARVEYFEWINDFAAARNESLKYASGDWIFILDADERIDPANLIHLKQAAASGLADVFSCRIADVTPNGAILQNSQVLRLFPNRRGIVFESPLHHNIMRHISRLGLKTAHTDIMIHHYGYTPPGDASGPRNNRNFQVLSEAVVQNPGDFLSRIARLEYLFMFNRAEEAVKSLEEILIESPEDLFPYGYLGRSMINSVNYMGTKGELGRTEKLLERLLIEYPLYRSFWAWAGTLYQNELKNPAKAALVLERVVRLPEDDVFSATMSPMIDLSNENNYRILGTAYAMLGSLPKARKAFQTGYGIDQSLKLQENIEELRARGTLAASAGKWREAEEATTEAMVWGGAQRGDWLSLAGWAIKNENLDGARRYCVLALKEDPNSPSALTLSGVIALQEKRSLDGLEAFIRASLIDPQNSTAAEYLKELARMSGRDTAGLFKLQGMKWAQDGQKPIAVKALKAALALCPDDEEIINNLDQLRQ